MQDENLDLGPQENSNTPRSTNDPNKECGSGPLAVDPEAARIRAARAKFIEETTYRLTDLFTIISARLELLGENVPEALRLELLGIRNILARGVELNNRLYLTAQACRREIGRPLTTMEIIDE